MTQVDRGSYGVFLLQDVVHILSDKYDTMVATGRLGPQDIEDKQASEARSLMDFQLLELLNSEELRNYKGRAHVILALTSRNIYTIDQFFDIALFALNEISRERGQLAEKKENGDAYPDDQYKYKLITLKEEEALRTVLHVYTGNGFNSKLSRQRLPDSQMNLRCLLR